VTVNDHDPFVHYDQAWSLEGNPFPQTAISGDDSGPWVDIFPEKRLQFYSRFIRGAVSSGLDLGYLWSQGPHGDTGYGKTRLMRHARDVINSDFGATVLNRMRMRPGRRRPLVAAAYTSLNTMNNTGLYPVLFSAANDLAYEHGDAPSIYDRARRLIVEKLAHEENIDTEEVTPDMIATDIRMARLETAPRGGPLRAQLVDAFASGEGMMPQAFGSVTDATRLRSGLAYLDFALAVLAAAKIDHLFLFIDQLEDLATNKAISRAKRSREIGRIRDLQEQEPYSGRLHMIFTFHATAARVLEEFWETHRLPPYEVSPTNAASIVVLTGLEDDDKVADLLKAYLALNRLDSVDDELLPFEPEAVTILRLASEGRVGILLTMAHGMLATAAEAGVPTIDGEFARNHLTGIGHSMEPDEEALILGDVDDLLLGG
jgi:hypothetical protein